MAKLEPASADFLDTAPTIITAERTVATTRSQCWDILIDQASWPNWFDGMTAVKAIPWVWTQPGQTRTVKLRGMKVHEVAISMQPQTECAFAIVQWPPPIATRAAEGVRLADGPEAGTTTLTYIGAFELNRFGERVFTTLENQLCQAWASAFDSLAAYAITMEDLR